MRLNRFLAAAGLGSRRSCEELILAGKVSINGQICQTFATEVSDEDFVKVGGKHILPDKHRYILIHKPKGYLCTASDTHGRNTIFQLLPGQWPRLFHVGRLDLDSEGLLILTNDGDLALHLTHPRFKIEKEYEVLLDHPYDAAKDTPRLLRGVSIEGGRAKASSIRQLSPTLLRIVLQQGLKRQIRLMLYKVGYEVKRLIRIRIGPLRLAGLHAGEWRILTPAEVKALRDYQPKPPPQIAARPGDGKTGHPPRDGKSPARREGRAGKAREGGSGRRPAGRSGITGGSVSSTPRAVRRP